MFYKILMDGVIVDAIKNPWYVRWQERSKMLLAIGFPEKAGGVLSSDGSTAYHLDGLPEIPVDGIPTVSMVEISEEEYLTIREQLDEGLTPVLPEEEAAGEESTETVLSLAQLQQKILAINQMIDNIIKFLHLDISVLS